MRPSGAPTPWPAKAVSTQQGDQFLRVNTSNVAEWGGTFTKKSSLASARVDSVKTTCSPAKPACCRQLAVCQRIMPMMSLLWSHSDGVVLAENQKAAEAVEAFQEEMSPATDTRPPQELPIVSCA